MPRTTRQQSSGFSEGLFGIAEALGGRIAGQDKLEDKRRYDETFEEGQRQFDTSMEENQRQFNLSYEEGVRQFDINDEYRRIELERMVEMGFLDRQSAELIAERENATRVVTTQIDAEERERDSKRDYAQGVEDIRTNAKLRQSEQALARSSIMNDQRSWYQAVRSWKERGGTVDSKELERNPALRESYLRHMAGALGLDPTSLERVGPNPDMTEAEVAAFQNQALSALKSGEAQLGESAFEQEIAAGKAETQTLAERAPLMPGYNADVAGRAGVGGGVSAGFSIEDFQDPLQVDPRTGEPIINPQFVENMLGPKGVGTAESLDKLDALINDTALKSAGDPVTAYRRRQDSDFARRREKIAYEKLQEEINLFFADSPTLRSLPAPWKQSLKDAYLLQGMQLYDYQSNFGAAQHHWSRNLGGTLSEPEFLNNFQASLQEVDWEVEKQMMMKAQEEAEVPPANAKQR